MRALRHARSDCPKPLSLWRLRVKHDAQSAAETCRRLYLSYDGYALTHAGH
jgi:hypothetical protein